jgi:hypothetical protein
MRDAKLPGSIPYAAIGDGLKPIRSDSARLPTQAHSLRPRTLKPAQHPFPQAFPLEVGQGAEYVHV